MWKVPEPSSVHGVRLEDGTQVTLRRHGKASGQRLVLSHGNGLAIDLYLPFWSLLAEDFDLILYDLRNHGWNETGPLRAHTIPTFIKDHDIILETIDEIYGQKPTIGVFHSLSGLVSLLSPTRGSGFAARILLDPPLCTPGRSYEEFDIAATRTAAIARRRSDRFRSYDEFVGLLGFSPVFRHVVPGVLDLMARTTLRGDGTGDTYTLRCPREFEAQIIDYASSYSVLVDFNDLECPTKVLGADPLVPYSYLPTLDLSDMLSVDYDFLPEATHFLPLEQPEQCAAIVRDYINSIGV
ncbi:MAG: alpha/beta hydrolase [bacterium]|nr:alpha/beta hydrolase [bacterium]